MDKYDLSDYLVWSSEANTLVIVYEVQAGLAGVTHLIVDAQSVFVEMLSRNRLVSASGVGTKMMAMVENLAGQLKKSRIRLHSLDTTVAWYELQGFKRLGEPRVSSEFGVLTPMEKAL